MLILSVLAAWPDIRSFVLNLRELHTCPGGSRNHDFGDFSTAIVARKFGPRSCLLFRWRRLKPAPRRPNLFIFTLRREMRRIRSHLERKGPKETGADSTSIPRQLPVPRPLQFPARPLLYSDLGGLVAAATAHALQRRRATDVATEN